MASEQRLTSSPSLPSLPSLLPSLARLTRAASFPPELDGPDPSTLLHHHLGVPSAPPPSKRPGAAPPLSPVEEVAPQEEGEDKEEFEEAEASARISFENECERLRLSLEKR